MVIKGVNCEISFIPLTKEFHRFQWPCSVKHCLGTYKCSDCRRGAVNDGCETWRAFSNLTKVARKFCNFFIASISLKYHLSLIRKWLTIGSVYGSINKKTVCFKGRQRSGLFKETGWDVTMFKQVRSRLSLSQKEPLDVVFEPPSGFVDVNGLEMDGQSDAKNPE